MHLHAAAQPERNGQPHGSLNSMVKSNLECLLHFRRLSYAWTISTIRRASSEPEAPRMEMWHHCATFLTRLNSTQTTADDAAPVHWKTYKKCSILFGFRHLILSQPNSVTHSQSFFLHRPIFHGSAAHWILAFVLDHPPTFIYNQSCPELVVKTSLTRLVLLSRFVVLFTSPLLAEALKF